MPNDTLPVDLDQSVDAWIENFNKTKGWKRLRVPNPQRLKTRGDDEDFARSPDVHFQALIDDIGDRDEIEEELGENSRRLDELTLARELMDEDEDSTDLDEEIAELEKAIIAARGDLKAIAAIEKQLAALTRVERRVPAKLHKLGERLDELTHQVETNGVELSTLDEEAVKRFRIFHGMVAGNIEHARDEVMTFTDSLPYGGSVVRNIAIINSLEYKLLFGLLEAAILQLQLGRIDAATEMVQRASDQLAEYRRVRMGATKVEPPVSLSSKIDQEVDLVETMALSLEQHGCALAAIARRKELKNLVGTITGAISSNDPEVESKFLPRCERLAELARMDVDMMRDMHRLLDEARKDVVAMRVNGHEHRPDRIEEMIDDFVAGADMRKALSEAHRIRQKAAETLEETLRQDTRREDIKPAVLQNRHAELLRVYDTLFKHNSDGTVRTQEDSKTQQQKGVKKSRHVPRETLEEVDLQIRAAAQLLDSESVEALRSAEEKLAQIERFLSVVSETPEFYRDFQKLLDKTESKLNEVAAKYPLYEVNQRSELKAALDKLKKDMPTKPQRELVDAQSALHQKVKEFKQKMGELQSDKRHLATRADTLEKTLNALGKVLTKVFTDEFTTYDGYHGEMRDRLEDIRSQIARRTEADLADATDALDQLETDATQVLRVLSAFKTDRQSLDSDEKQIARDFVRDARRGQEQHDKNTAEKDTYESESDELGEAIKVTIEAMKKLKADVSELEAMKGERKALDKEAKANTSYLEALVRLRQMADRQKKLLAEARAAAEIVDQALADAARTAAGRVRDFRDLVRGFYAAVLEPAAATSGGGSQLADGTIDAAKIKAFLTSIAVAIPEKALTDLEAGAAIAVDGGKDPQTRRKAQKSALAAVRALMAVLDGFKPIAHFRGHPFGDGAATAAYSGARTALPRIELRLLTAIPD